MSKRAMPRQTAEEMVREVAKSLPLCDFNSTMAISAMAAAIAARDLDVAADERAKFRPAIWWSADDEEGACYADCDHVLDQADLEDGEIIEICRAAVLPSEWAVNLAVARDADGFPMRHEIRFFATRAEAEAAVEAS